MFGRSGDIFEEEKPEEEKLTRAQRKEERLQKKMFRLVKRRKRVGQSLV